MHTDFAIQCTGGKLLFKKSLAIAQSFEKLHFGLQVEESSSYQSGCQRGSLRTQVGPRTKK